MALAIGLAPLGAQPENDADIVHAVDAGDTLTSIAIAYGVTLDQLLTLNDLDPEALLQIGQRLLVIRAAAFADDDEDDPEAVAEVAMEEPAAVGGNVDSGDEPPAPVAEADAPMRDPADISPRLCFAVFVDDNHNGMMEPDERLLAGATIRLLEANEAERLRYATDAIAEPFCERRLERKLYTLAASAPPGFGLTGASRLRIDLRPGGLVHVDIGAKAGMESPALPPQDGIRGGDQPAGEKPRSLLRELSGLFALGLAAVVFFSGMAVSLFTRWR